MLRSSGFNSLGILASTIEKLFPHVTLRECLCQTGSKFLVLILKSAMHFKFSVSLFWPTGKCKTMYMKSISIGTGVLRVQVSCFRWSSLTTPVASVLFGVVWWGRPHWERACIWQLALPIKARAQSTFPSLSQTRLPPSRTLIFLIREAGPFFFPYDLESKTPALFLQPVFKQFFQEAG